MLFSFIFLSFFPFLFSIFVVFFFLVRLFLLAAGAGATAVFGLRWFEGVVYSSTVGTIPHGLHALRLCKYGLIL